MLTRHGDFKFSFSENAMLFKGENIFHTYTSKQTFGNYNANTLININGYWIGKNILNSKKLRWIFGAGFQQYEVSYSEHQGYNYFNHSFSKYSIDTISGANKISSKPLSFGGRRMQTIFFGAGISIEQKLFNRWFVHATAMPNIGMMFASRELRADTLNNDNLFDKQESVSRGVVDTLATDFLDSKMVTSKFVNRFALKLKVNAGINYYITERLAASVDFGINYGIPHKAYVMDIEIYYPNQEGRPLFKRDKVYFTQNTVDIELGLKYKF